MQRRWEKLAVDTAAQAGALYAAWVMFRFGRDKVLGINSSIEGFQQIGAGLGVDPTAFRYFVGAQELGVALGLLTAAVLFVPVIPESLKRWYQRGFQLGALGLMATMGGAIATELIVRPGQQDWLLYLGIRLIVIGALLLGWSLWRFGSPLARGSIDAQGSVGPATVPANSATG